MYTGRHYKHGNGTMVYPKKPLKLTPSVDVHHVCGGIQLARILPPRNQYNPMMRNAHTAFWYTARAVSGSMYIREVVL